MGFTTVPTVATGDTWSAGDHNTYIRDNFEVGVPAILEAKGALPVGAGYRVAGPLPVGSNGQVLTADSAQALGIKWANITPPHYPQIFDAYDTTTRQYIAVTNWLSKSFTLNYQSTLMVFAYGVFRPVHLYDSASVRLVIDGGVYGVPVNKSCNSESTDVSWVPFSLVAYKTGAAAGGHSANLQAWNATQSVICEFDKAQLIILALPEV